MAAFENRQNQAMQGGREALVYPLVLLIMAGGFALLNFNYGVAEDTDAYILLAQAAEFPAKGYVPNRSFGFPLYELTMYPLLLAKGTTAGKLYSLFFMLLAVLIFFRLLRGLCGSASRAFWGGVAFAAHPLVIISGNSLMETSQGLFFAVGGLYFFCLFGRGQKKWQLACLALCLGAATATRPDFVCLAAAMWLVLWLKKRAPLWWLVLWGGLFLAVALAPHLIYNQAFYPQLGQVDALNEPLARKFPRAAFGVLGLLGPAAAVLLGLLAARWLWRGPRQAARQIWAADLHLLWAVASAIYLARYVLLPDELEYIIALLPLLLAALVAGGLPRPWLIALALALTLPNAVTPHFFTRGPFGRLAFSPGLSPGAVAQERGVRLRNQYLYGPLKGVQKEAARRLGCPRYVANSFDGAPGDCLVVASQSLRYFGSGRFGGRFHELVKKQRVIIYPMPDHRGWRQFIAYQPFRKVSLKDFRVVDPFHPTAGS